MSSLFAEAHLPLSPASSKKKKWIRPTAIRVTELQNPLVTEWEDPPSFQAALDLHMRRHGDTNRRLVRAVVKSGEIFDEATFAGWRRGIKSPRAVGSMKILARIEDRYRLPKGYFRKKLPHPARSSTGHDTIEIATAERRRLAWHLPDDYDSRSITEREEILSWVRKNIIGGATDYRLFHARMMRHRFAVHFPDVGLMKPNIASNDEFDEDGTAKPRARRSNTITAPAALALEMADLIAFKTSALTMVGLQRSGVWGEETAAQKVEHLGLMFGALVASSKSAIQGRGVPLHALTFGILVFPAVWDWYVGWRERRRGFYTVWEIDMLRVALALTRQETGWLRQHPELALKLIPIDGLITTQDIDAARTNWDDTCERFHKHALGRAKEIQRIARVHHDPFEPILAVLEADSPLAEYRKIADEILRLMPDESRYPVSAAEAVRSYLLLRVGMHTGLRQKNLRQLLLQRRGEPPRSERLLSDRKRGELRWSERESGWEVFIPAVAFKNANSSFFGQKPFRLVLPNLGGLYPVIESYLDRHRQTLLRDAHDPATLFVKTTKSSSKSAAYDQNTFYEAWRLVIQRYGIFNPYTERGAIKGLLPHGPHSIRDVLATHILKRTGSYEQASYAIQDTPEMVAQHYGRFLPHDKSALAAQILNKIWESP